MSNNWPAFRTPIQPINITQVRAAILAAIFTIILVPVLGYSIILWNGLLETSDAIPPPSSLPSYISLAGSFLLISAVLAWLGMIFGIFASFRAQRKGWAGWAIALLTGFAIGAIFGGIMGLDSQTALGVLYMASGMGLVGLVYAGTYWLLFRLLYSKAFRWSQNT